ncbi:putative zinc transporter msc2, partial [Lambiella insularis]|nr:putative zinc transporter msc2 [Lambiella insularis]
MDHGRPRFLATLPRLESGYGFPATRPEGQSPIQASGSNPAMPVTILEIISSILIPLPLLLVSLVSITNSPSPITNSIKADFIRPNKVAVEGQFPSYFELQIVGVVTSATLLAVGSVGKWQGRTDVLDRRKRSHSSLGPRGEKTKSAKDLVTIETARRLARRVLAVGLPFLSVSMVGGLRAATILLVAIAGDFSNFEGSTADVSKPGGWRRLIESRVWTLLVILFHVLIHLAGLILNAETIWPPVTGYLCLGISAFTLPLPHSTSRVSASSITSPMPRSAEKTSAVSTPWEAPPAFTGPSNGIRTRSPLISTPKDTNITLLAGVLTAVISAVFSVMKSPSSTSISISQMGIVLLVSAIGAFSLSYTYPKSLMTERKFGLAIGFVALVLFQEMSDPQSWLMFAYQGVGVGFLWIALNIDTLSARVPHLAVPRPRQHRSNAVKSGHSRFTELLLLSFREWPLLHSILMEKDSRRIFFFMCLNFSFMLVQTFYAVVTGSLGLLSDSIHMLFDCLALVVGLCAAVMSKWPPSVRFPYGFGKMDTLAGFANGVFLMLISVEIIYEAIERLVEGSQMQRIGELLTVSSLGLLVNLVGMFAFGHAHHGHGHSHGGHHDHSHGEHERFHHEQDCAHDGHEHSHEGHDHSHMKHDLQSSSQEHSESTPSRPALDNHRNTSYRRHSRLTSSTLHDATSPPSMPIPSTPTRLAPDQSHPRSHGHHHHGNENMQGIFLHVLADTLGSVAVVFSTVLIHYTGWAGFDPLASCLIAVLIFASAVPLVTSSAKRLLLAVPEDTEFDLREALAEVGSLKGVIQVQVPRFWMEEGEEGGVQGVMHVVVARGVDVDD